MTLTNLFPTRARSTSMNTTPPPSAPNVRKMSDAAALAAQHVIDLETTVADMRALLNGYEGRMTAADKINEELSIRITVLEKELDYYKNRCTQIETQLRTSANIILDALRDPLKSDATIYQRGSAEEVGLRAVSDSTQERQEPDSGQPEVPAFVKRPNTTEGNS